MPGRKYYFDTSIWLDFLEKRDEPNFPKSEWAVKLIDKIIRNKDYILFSDNNLVELVELNYSEFEIEAILERFGDIIIKVEATERQLGVSKDLSFKRKIPLRDALHALIARDNNAILVTFDHDFRQLIDIKKSYRTNELI